MEKMSSHILTSLLKCAWWVMKLSPIQRHFLPYKKVMVTMGTFVTLSRTFCIDRTASEWTGSLFIYLGGGADGTVMSQTWRYEAHLDGY